MGVAQGSSAGATTLDNSARIHEAGCDPWLVRHEGRIYYTHTTLTDIRIWAADNLYDVGKGEPAYVWTPGVQHGALAQNIWAPELHYLDGRWYIYFAGNDGLDENHRCWVLESRRGPLGPYSFKGKVACPKHDYWAVDGTVWNTGDRRYFIWSGWSGEPDGRQHLYIAEMLNPWTLLAPRHLLSTPTESWELGVNESPHLVEREGCTYIIYSADRLWSNKYKLGALRYLGGDPLTQAAWTKVSQPLYNSATCPERAQSFTTIHSSHSDLDPGPWRRTSRTTDLLFACEREDNAEQWRWVSAGDATIHPAKPRPVSIEVVKTTTSGVRVIRLDDEFELA